MKPGPRHAAAMPGGASVKRTLLLAAALLALAGCQADEPTLGGTVIGVAETERADALSYLDESAKYYEHPLVPEVGQRVEVRLDDGSAVTVQHNGSRRYEPGDRVRLLKDSHGDLFL